MIKKTTLTQTVIEAIVSRSEQYATLKAQNDANVDCIDAQNVAIAELTEAISNINQVLHKYESFFTMIFSDLPPGGSFDEIPWDDVKDPNKQKLN